MKRYNQFLKYTLAIIFIAIIFNSCKKDDENLPDYVGTWYSINENEDKDLIILGKSSYEQYHQIKKDNNYTNVLGVKGNLTVNSDILTITINSIGIDFGYLFGNATGTITWIKQGDESFDQMLQYLGKESLTFKFKYKVIQNTLMLKEDIDGNGSFDDEIDQTYNYTRQ